MFADMNTTNAITLTIIVKYVYARRPKRLPAIKSNIRSITPVLYQFISLFSMFVIIASICDISVILSSK